MIINNLKLNLPSKKIQIQSHFPKLKSIINNYIFHIIAEEFCFKDNLEHFQNIKESSSILVYHCSDNNQNEDFFILGFKNTIIIIYKTLLKLLYPLFLDNSELKIYFLPDTKTIFNELMIIPNQQVEIEDIYNADILSFSQKYQILELPSNFMHNLVHNIKFCISGYFILDSYSKRANYQMKFFSTTSNQEKSIEYWDELDYIELKTLGYGLSRVVLIYQIEKGELFALKKINQLDNEYSKLVKREFNNYLKLNFPLLPKFIGKVKNFNYLIIQFINGQTLDNIKNLKLTKEEKVKIIFELMLSINYFHQNQLIYRDLKPNNIIIDDNKTAIIIDFDRMVKYSDDKNFTMDLCSCFVAPEVKTGEISYKNDIFSIGQIIYYIMNEQLPEPSNLETKQLKLNSFFNALYGNCTDNDPNNRPTIMDLMFEIYSFFSIIINDSFMINFQEVQYFHGIISNKSEFINKDFNKSIHFLTLAANLNNPLAQINLGSIYLQYKEINKAINYFKLAADQNLHEAEFQLGLIYQQGIYIKRDINKAIYYYTLAAEQNNYSAQNNLALIYLDGKYIKQDIKKAIYYFELAANQKCSNALCNLGIIYSKGMYVKRDINKGINFLKLAADQNYSEAQYQLGFMYEQGIHIGRDISKSIYYYTKAAKQNNIYSQYNLGIIYYEGYYIKQNTNKAIYYFSLAADQNLREAQNLLGRIYYEGKYIKQDLIKAIYYYTKAANQNIQEAQFKLGLIYSDANYAKRDINKAIYYYSLAANQNDATAQNNLGNIYYEGKYISQDIKKAIYYFTLAANQNLPTAQYKLGEIYINGKYINQNIKMAIYYYTLSSNNNFAQASNELGNIYYEGKYVPKDINRGIFYYTLAANKNLQEAQFNLGLIYSDVNYAKRDINKAIYYYTLTSKQNNYFAQNNLALIYLDGKYIKQDIEKAIYYLEMSANQKLPFAAYNLGLLYLYGTYIKQNISKAIYYLKLAAYQNYSKALFILGIIYSTGLFSEKNMIKGIDFFIQSSKKGDIDAHFVVGYFYQEGKYIQKNIGKSIYHYKEASSFYNQYAKNNLGIIYKNGIGIKNQKNISQAITYFEEAIRQRNDFVCMYNLSHIYIYEDQTIEHIDKSIDLLIKASANCFNPAIQFLCIPLIIKYGTNLENIKDELQKKTCPSSNLTCIICQLIRYQRLFDKKFFEQLYKIYKDIDYLYNFLGNAIQTKKLNGQKQQNHSENDIFKNMPRSFFEGFGNDI